MKRKQLSFVALLLFFPLFVNGQSTSGETSNLENTINVFLDGNFIDENFVKEEFPYVNYVRTRDASDVHVLGTLSRTSAGVQYEFYFFGLKDFSGKTDTLKYFASGQATQTETREGYTKVLKMGLMRYLALSDHILDINVASNIAPRGGNVVQEDPWDSWVFDASLRGSLSGQETSKTNSFDAGFSATRVTPAWRHELQFEYANDYSEYILTNYTRKTRLIDASVDLYEVKALGPHAGAGIIGHMAKNTRDNYDLQVRLAAAIEYNFFPYEMSSRRQLSVGYYFGVDGRDYIDTAVHNVMKETLLYEQLSLAYSQREQWGNVYSSVTFKNFMNNFSENSITLNGGLNFRIWKGLSWNLSGSYSLLNDEINLRKEEASSDDVITGARRAPTNMRYSFNTGLSFTFGSVYNNVVNTRLRSMTGMGGGGGFSGGGGGGGGYR
jgi:hypothetical protein